MIRSRSRASQIGAFWWLLLTCLSSAVAAPDAPNARFHHWTLDDGLSQSTVNAIVQDRHGFIWLGTQDGLNRFDGTTFEVFKNRADEPGSLPHNFVWSLLVARDGALWIGTDGGGLARLPANGQRFERVLAAAPDADLLAEARVRGLAEGSDGTIWVGLADGGLVALAPRTLRARRYRNDPADPGSLGSDAVRTVLVDAKGVVWVGTDGAGLDRLDPGADRFVHHRHDPGNPRSLSGDRVRSLHRGARGTLWVGCYEGGLNRLDAAGASFERFARREGDPGSLAHDRVRTVLEDRDGVVWVGTDGGLSRLEGGASTFFSYRHSPTDAFSLSADRVLSLYQDAGGVLWVATQAGLDTWNPTLGSFAHIHQGDGGASSIGSDLVTAFAADPDGAIWVGTYGGGLDRLDRRRKRIASYRRDPANPDSLADDRVMSLLRDREGAIWIGTFEGGLDRLDPSTGRIEHHRHDPADPASLSANGVTALHEDPAGRLWVGLHRGGLCRFDRETRGFDCRRAVEGDPRTLSSDRVMCLAGDASGALWIGTEGGGLNLLDPATGRISRIVRDPDAAGSLSSDVVWSIREGRDGTLWIGTPNGLNAWGPEDRRSGLRRFRVFTTREGLPNEAIYAILEDRQGRLWLSTNRGIARFEPGTGRVVAYDASYGLQSNEFNFGAALASPNGEMLFGGNNGFNVFRPEEIHPNENVPAVVVTGILRFDEPMPLEAPPWSVPEVTLKHVDHAVTFEFSAIDYTAPWRNKVQFRLDGFDERWLDPGSAHRATYTSLPPGRYVFRVRGSNGHGVWSARDAAIGVTVLPPPWRTAWAYALYTALAGAALILLIRAIRRRRRREAEYRAKLEAEVRVRTAELAERNLALAEVNAKLEEASLTDALTGLHNRRYMMTQLTSDLAIVDRAWARWRERATDELPPSFLFCVVDLDGFKPVNDRFGHEVGDRVLCAVRDALLGVSRTGDVVIRLGGDEFLVVCRQAERGRAPSIAERLRDAVAAARVDVAPGSVASVGCSVGFALYPFSIHRPRSVGWERVLALADRALYLAKGAGKRAWIGILCNERTPVLDEIPDVLEDPLGAAGRGVVSISCSTGTSLERPTPAGSSAPAAR